MPEYILGIDYGSKRIGLAIGQSLTASASPLKVIANDNNLWQKLSDILKEWQIQHIIVGLPLNKDGSDQKFTVMTRKFADQLQQKLSLKVDLHDERYTSFAAERAFQEQRAAGHKKSKDKDQIDAMAAQIILQSWLDENL
ncbi:Holliday junction resolvase RuvX [Marinicella sp. W31]|uniref:Holliday junction resolvase RuvX n=1 Tax=Marinicella sp. W31 TaxID=3023713 RepID=UPI0037578268